MPNHIRMRQTEHRDIGNTVYDFEESSDGEEGGMRNTEGSVETYNWQYFGDTCEDAESAHEESDDEDDLDVTPGKRKRKKREWIVEEATISQFLHKCLKSPTPCCRDRCVTKFTPEKIKACRHDLWDRRDFEQRGQFILDSLKSADRRGDGQATISHLNCQGHRVCQKAWYLLYGVSHGRQERQVYWGKAMSSLHDPTDKLSIIIDGMDQSKTALPHFMQATKESEKWKLRTHITGVLVHTLGVGYAFIDNLRWPHDSNLTCTVLLATLRKVAKSYNNRLPGTLYLQMDNCWRECKNQYVFAFLGLLVLRGIFKEVQVGYLLVGHTHEDVDQFFSRVAEKLRKRDATTVEELVDVIEKSFPNVEGEELDAVLDVKDYMGDVCNHLEQHSCPHQYRFTTGLDSKLIVEYKNFGVDEEWKLPRRDEVRLVERLPPAGARPSLVKPRTERLELKQFETGVSTLWQTGKLTSRQKGALDRYITKQAQSLEVQERREEDILDMLWPERDMEAWATERPVPAPTFSQQERQRIESLYKSFNKSKKTSEQAKIQSIEEIKVPKNKRCGILPFVSSFEEFAELAETIFKGSERRADLDKAYSRMVRTIFDNVERVGLEHQKTPQDVVLFAVFARLKITCLESEKKEARHKYKQHLNAYVINWLGHPMEKLNHFFEGIEARVAQGVKAEEVGYQLAFSKQELRKVIKEYPMKEVKKGLESLYKKVEKHLCEEENLNQVVWRSMQEEFISQYKHFEDLIKRCYPESGITLEFTITDILQFFSDIAQSH
uniref:Uncharacterized protein n=1 Tax=Branchiostoma floridae TaxID=7739 RepID=C3ZUF5_BRAFL|eukprot:XP_002587783.1 hypothetical protein BRAFLDRAFT_92228 [Branchiostoma floridae]